MKNKKQRSNAFSAERAFSAGKNENNVKNEENAIVSTDKTLLETPVFPPIIYDLLPGLIKEICDHIEGDRNKDVTLTGLIVTLSSCLEKVKGKYGVPWYYPNLMGFIIGPAGKGKSNLKLADKLLHYHLKVTDQEFKKKMDEYEQLIIEYNQASDKTSLKKPQKPTRRRLKIPGNSSKSRVYQLLKNNEGAGIIIETEADALGETFESDWGSFSVLIRCAFGNEGISMGRVKEEQSIEVEQPKLAVVLTGTPNQLYKIVPSAEDGLASRFLYYGFSAPREWKSQRPTEKSYLLDELLEVKSKKVHDLIVHYQRTDLVFNFTKDQWEEIDVMFSLIMRNIIDVFNESVDSIIFRLGLILFKICMTLTSIRAFESRLEQTQWDCHPDDFIIGKKLIRIYLQHSLLIFENLPKATEKEMSPIPAHIGRLIKSLDGVFATSEAIAINNRFGISERTTYNHINKAEELGLIEKDKHGYYRKL